MTIHRDADSSMLDATRMFGTGNPPPALTVHEDAGDLYDRYQQIVSSSEVTWDMTYRLVSRLGAGGQGVVFLADRSGAFDVNFQLALKFYRPDGYPDVQTYRREMARMAKVNMATARIQQDHLVDVYNVVEYRGILVLVSEWVDGYDLRHLTTPKLLKQIKRTVDNDRWAYINDVIITDAGFQSRLKPGVAIAIIRECLSGLAALHRQGIIHADLKPANVMVKQTGNCKIIDLGSAFMEDEYPLRPTWTPRYAAVEVLEGARHTPLSDLASLGYVLLELLSGKYPFAGVADGQELISVKRDIWNRIPDLLPKDVARNNTLVQLISKMIAPNPADRFTSLEEADLSPYGASEIQRQLVKVNMTTEVENEMRILMQEFAEGSSPEAKYNQLRTG
ncbi:serine/threonine-protein kinase [Planctomicrobium sp. SH661]|uniref:serine/threonine-protein kinase n=1 Tax=Planctomicrobium sp. SH661 TaxID=3448124 RepID=UPI003F5B03E3